MKSPQTGPSKTEPGVRHSDFETSDVSRIEGFVLLLRPPDPNVCLVLVWDRRMPGDSVVFCEALRKVTNIFGGSIENPFVGKKLKS